MPTFKQLRFKIDGKIDGVDYTPTTIPMARLAEYLTDLAVLLGHKESVHLVEIRDGSAMPVVYYDALEEARIFSRVRGAVQGTGDPDAVEAYQKIDRRLKRDNGYGLLVNGVSELAEFPGVRQPELEKYPKIRQRVTLVGKVRRVGGKGQTIPIWIERADKRMFYCETNEHLSRELADHYLKLIRVHGIGTYIRTEDSKWEQTNFTIQSYDPAPVADESIAETFDKLRAVEGNEWNEIKDPLAELRRIRHGDEEQIQ